MTEPVARPIVGFRQWTFDRDGLLAPTSDGYDVLPHWNPEGPTVAACPADRYGLHAAPIPACGCGLHARYSLDDRRLRHLGLWRLIGAIVAWGRIELHEESFRAQYARPIALLRDPDEAYPDLRDRTAERYRVPRLERPELVRYAEWFGDRLTPLPPNRLPPARDEESPTWDGTCL